MADPALSSRFVRWRRPMLLSAGLVWVLVAGWGAWLYCHGLRNHARATEALRWIERSAQLEHQLTAFVSGISEDSAAQRTGFFPLIPANALAALASSGFVARTDLPGLPLEDLVRRFVADGERFRRELGEFAQAPPEARHAAVQELQGTTLRLLLVLGDLGDLVRRDLVGAENSLNVSGAALWLFALIALLAVLLLVILLRDSTRRERWLAESRALLSESEQRFREIANGVPVVLVISDADRNITFTNEAWREFTGSSDHSFERWREIIHPDDQARIGAEYEVARNAEQPWEFEFRVRRKDGEWRWWLDRGVPRRDARGRLLGYAALCLDITDRKLFEERNLESQRMEAMGRLAGGIAHDLNNILTVVLGSADLLFHAPEDAAAVRENAEEIRSVAERAAQLVAQLLAFTRRQVVAPAALDVAEAVRGTAGLLRRLIGEDVELAIEAPPDTRRVTIDPAQLMQVILNLVINARQAMPEGGRIGIEVRAAASAPPAGERIELTVRDDGAGMDAETRSHVFEPFFTTKDDGRHAGLGLATVKTIVEQAGGRIEVESAVGRGTTVRVTLPAAISTGEPPRERTGPELVWPPRERATILLVEDDDAVRPLLRRYLERDGHRVVDAGGGIDALEIARREPVIDLLLTDVVMPEVGGRKLAGSIAPLHPSMQVLYMSGYTDDEVLRRGVSQEEQPFIQKPFSREEFLRRVNGLLAARRSVGGVSS